jgi:hypothetical protein
MDLDKAPYFVTLALALFGWSANHVVNRIIDAPTLEYQIQDVTVESTAQGKSHRVQRITLTNLTRKQTFEDLSVMLVSRKGSPLESEHLQLRPIPPAFEGDDSWEAEGGRATFTIPKLHPGNSVQVVSAFQGENPPVFRIKSKGTVFATNANWETWFVRNEVLVLTPLAILWALIIGLYAYGNWSSYKSAAPSPDPAQTAIDTETKS